MLRIFFLIFTSLWITGCVGAKTYNEITYTEKYYEPETLDELNIRHKDLIAGNNERSYKYTKDETAWCGVVIYAVILPIPLMAPVCEESSEFYIENGVSVKKVSSTIQKGGKVCGPVQLFFNGLMSFGQGYGWCS